MEPPSYGMPFLELKMITEAGFCTVSLRCHVRALPLAA
jgi:hypothetical protein